MPEIETLKLKVGLNTDTAVQDAKRLGKDIQNTLSQVDTSKLDSKTATLIKNLTAIRDRTAQLAKELEELGEKKIPTDEYKEIEKQLRRDQVALDRLDNRMTELRDKGETKSDAYRTAQAKYSELVESIHYARDELKDLEETGKAFTLGKDTDEYTKKVNQLNQLAQAENILLQREEERQRREQERQEKEDERRRKEETRQYEAVQKEAEKNAAYAMETPKIEEKGKKVEEAEKKTKKATKAEKEHTKAVRESSNAHRNLAGNLKKTLVNILKYTVGITTLVALFRKLRSMATEAFKVMAQEIPEVNTAISNMATSMKEVKAAAGTMLQPLLQVLSPIITAITQKITELMNTMAKLFAMMSGQNYIYEASVDYYDYAKSVEEASGALAGFDKLNVVGSGKKNSMALTKDTVHYAKKYFDTVSLADNKLIQTFKKVKELVESIVNSFKKAWNEGAGARILELAQRRIQALLNIVNNLAGAFQRAWENAGVGDGIAETLLGIYGDISEFITQIMEDTAEWASTLDLAPLFESVSGFLEKIRDFLQPILRIVRKIYKDFILPMTGWIMEKLAPALLDLATNILDKITKVLEWLEPKLTWLMNNVIKPIAETLGQAILDIIGEIGDYLDGDFSDTLEGIFKFLDEDLMPILEYLFGFLTILLQNAIKHVARVVRNLLTTFDNLLTHVKDILSGICEFITGVFSLDLEKAFGGIKKIVMGALNVILDGIEAIVNGAIGAINTVGGLIGVEFDYIHLKRWGETDEEYEKAVQAGKVHQLSAPDSYAWQNLTPEQLENIKKKFGRIPHGASGMVLPPNKPFLAMVGDQTNGTNVETPLSTIEQAVANVIAKMGVKVTFDVKGDSKGLFKVWQKEAKVYSMQFPNESLVK